MVFSVEGGISLMVEHQFSKLRAGVRFSYPAQRSEPLFCMPRHTFQSATPTATSSKNFNLLTALLTSL
jgi:hypothetical protein